MHFPPKSGMGLGQALVNIMPLKGIFGLFEPEIRPETRIFIFFLEKNKNKIMKK